MQTINVITPLVRDELKGTNYSLWECSLAAPNGSHYGIPAYARRVAKFNPLDKSFTLIGPDFGDGYKWERGAMTDNGIIYCVSSNSNRGILKIDTNTDTALELDVNLLPERDEDEEMWKSCAAALDGCIYFMPYGARRIMKLDPNNGDAMSSVGDDLGGGYDKYIGTVVGIDGYVYGIPYESQLILKYDPINDNTYFIGEVCPEYFKCIGNGALARDGFIYAVAGNGGLILEIDTKNNSWSLVGKISRFFCDGRDWIDKDWCDAVVGTDGCIYWPPVNARRILKYDPYMNETLVAGDDFGLSKRWYGGCLATDGVIYCFPTNANQEVLAIDPFREFSETTKTNMKDHPGKFGSIFEKVTFEAHEDTDEEEDEDTDEEENEDTDEEKNEDTDEEKNEDTDEEKNEDTHEEKNEDAHEEENEDTHEEKNKDTHEEENEDTHEEKNEDTHEEKNEDMHEEENEDTHEEKNEDTHEEKNEDTHEEKNEDMHEEKICLTNFDIAAFKFGHNKVFEVLWKHLTPINDYCEESNLYPFMLVASQKESELYAIHHLLRRDLSWVNKCISSLELKGKSMTKRKRKYDHSL